MTLLPRRSPLAPRPTGLKVSPDSYQSPKSVYRRILRLAKVLSLRWSEDAIFQVHRHLAQRFLAQHSRALASKSAENPPPPPSPTEPVQIPVEQYRPFKRLKQQLSLLTKAEHGQRQPMEKVLDWTFARRGELRWRALRPFMQPPRPANIQAPVAPSPAFIALLINPASGGGNRSSALLAPSGPTFTLPLPREGTTGGSPSQKLENKLRNATAETVKRTLDKLKLPLGISVIQNIEANAVSIPDDGAETPLQSKTQQSATVGHRFGTLHPSAPNFSRQKRRIWGFLLSEIPILPPPPPLPDGSMSFVLQQLASHHARQQSPKQMDFSGQASSLVSEPRRTHRFWLSRRRLPTDDIPLLVSAWNQYFALSAGPLSQAQRGPDVSSQDFRIDLGALATSASNSKGGMYWEGKRLFSDRVPHLPFCFSMHALAKLGQSVPGGESILLGTEKDQSTLSAYEPRLRRPSSQKTDGEEQASGSVASQDVEKEDAEAERPAVKNSGRAELQKSRDSPLKDHLSQQTIHVLPNIGKIARAMSKTTARLGSHHFVSQEEADWARRQ